MSVVSLLRRLGRCTGRARFTHRRYGGKPPHSRSLVANGGPSARDAARLAAVLRDYPCWSVFWDKRHAMWRTAEDDPGSNLYAEDAEIEAVISYITAHS